MSNLPPNTRAVFGDAQTYTAEELVRLIELQRRMPHESTLTFNVEGSPGSGKTSLVSAHLRKQGYNVLIINAGMAEVVTIGGILNLAAPDKDGTEKPFITNDISQAMLRCTQVGQERIRAELFAAAAQAKGTPEYDSLLEKAKSFVPEKWAIIFDDYHAVTKQVSSAMHPLLDSQKAMGQMGEYPLLENTPIIFLSNGVQHGVPSVARLNPATHNRQVLIRYVTNPIESLDHLEHIVHKMPDGREVPFDPQMAAHLRKNLKDINPLEDEKQAPELIAQGAFPSSRMWETISALKAVHQSIENPDAEVFMLLVHRALGEIHGRKFLEALYGQGCKIPTHLSIQQARTAAHYVEAMPASSRLNMNLVGAPGIGKTSSLMAAKNEGYEVHVINVAAAIQPLFGGLIDFHDLEDLSAHIARLNDADLDPELRRRVESAMDKVRSVLQVKLSEKLFLCTEESEERTRQEMLKKAEEKRGAPEYAALLREAQEYKAPPTMLVLDEVQEAVRPILTALMPMFDGRRSAGVFSDKKLRSNTVVIATSNGREHGSMPASHADAAIRNRLVEIPVVSNPEETLAYFQKHKTQILSETGGKSEVGFDSRLWNFLNKHRQFISPMEDPEQRQEILKRRNFPTPRKWVDVSAFLQICGDQDDPRLMYKVVSDMVGYEPYGKSLVEYLRNDVAQKIPSAADFLKNPLLIFQFKDDSEQLPIVLSRLLAVPVTNQQTFDTLVDIAMQLGDKDRAGMLNTLTSDKGDQSKMMPFIKASPHAEVLREFIVNRIRRDKENERGTRRAEMDRKGFRI